MILSASSLTQFYIIAGLSTQDRWWTISISRTNPGANQYIGAA